ncbi:MAG: flagellar hook-associated protein 2 [Actinomycetota bacterium]|nr:flagellar hook-associated protein 2 [Actinomycetota bacterium]
MSTITPITTGTNSAGSPTISGIISGLNTSALVAAEIQAESAPQQALQAQVATDNTLLTALQSLNASYASLATQATEDSAANAWNVFTTASSDPSVTATTTTDASGGSISFGINSIAASQVDVTAPMEDSATTPTFTIVGSDGTQTAINPVSGSVADIVDAINKSSAGVSAIAVASGTDATTGESLYRLQLSSTASGAAGAFTIYQGSPSEVTAGTATDLLTAPGAAAIQSASDASVTLWAGTAAAQTVTSSNNTFSNLLPGVSVTVSAMVANPVTLTLSQDAATISTAASYLVGSVNTVLQSIATSSAVTSSTDASGNVTTSGGPFSGDGSVRDAAYQLFNALAQPGSGVSPGTIGFVINQDGTLTFDAATFQAALASDPVGTKTMLSQIASQVATQATAQSDPVTGTLTSRISSLTNDISGLNTQVSAWTTTLATRQTQLESAYAAMESQMGTLQSQSAWLSQMFPTTITSSSGSGG